MVNPCLYHISRFPSYSIQILYITCTSTTRGGELLWEGYNFFLPHG